jgi:hypothetical protein
VSACCASASRNSSRWRPACVRLLALILSLGVLPISASVAAQAPKSAPVTCATCHVGVAAHYTTAPMRHAMEPQGSNPVLTSHPNLGTKIGNYSYSVQTRDGQSTYTVTDGTESMTLPIRWIFGQHSQTWVLEKNGLLYESLVSYFPRDNVLATTPGDQSVTPTNLTEAMGRELSVWESRSCFNCHATGIVPGEKMALDKLTLGLDCDRCHEGAQKHMADAAHDNYSTLPKSLKRMDPEEVSNFCGQCHRNWDTVVRNHWHGPAFVRFQPYRLANSKCFIGNDKRISCLACHDPHQPVIHDQAYYDSKCLACHSAAKTTAAPSLTKVCSVSRNNCTTCHMPKVELPGGHSQFTDHQIRIARAGDPYPN